MRESQRRRVQSSFSKLSKWIFFIHFNLSNLPVWLLSTHYMFSTYSQKSHFPLPTSLLQIFIVIYSGNYPLTTLRSLILAYALL